MCFTDHGPTSDGFDAAHRMSLSEYPSYQEQVVAIQREHEGHGPRVFFGVEADFYEAGIPFLGQWLPQQGFDLVLGSIHFLQTWGFDDPDERHVWDSVDVTGTWREYFALLGRLADSRLFDVVGHLDLPKKFGYRPPDRELKDMALPVLDKIAAAGMAIELNTGGLRKPVKEIYPSQALLAWACERKIPICFGSDAHRPEEVGYAFGDAVRWARGAGYDQSAHWQARRQMGVPLP